MVKLETVRENMTPGSRIFCSRITSNARDGGTNEQNNAKIRSIFVSFILISLD